MYDQRKNYSMEGGNFDVFIILSLASLLELTSSLQPISEYGG
jgi:hypothetical protein